MRGHGTLTIHIKSASNLIKADFAGLSDPYVNVSVAGQPPRRSKTIKKTLDPNWDEKIDFEGVLEVLLTEPLFLQVFDQDFGVSALFGMVGMAHSKASSDDKLGKVWRSRTPRARVRGAHVARGGTHAPASAAVGLFGGRCRGSRSPLSLSTLALHSRLQRA